MEEDPESGERKLLSVILAGGLLNRTGPITDKYRERYFCDSQLVNSARKTRNEIFADEESTKRLRERKREEHHDRQQKRTASFFISVIDIIIFC